MTIDPMRHTKTLTTSAIQLARGFTLIELMITVAIVAILGSIAYPAYTSQIAKGKRAECRGGLLQAIQQQERYFTQYNKFVAFSAGAASGIKSFSGDSAGTSSCLLAAEACDSTSGITSCVIMKATPTGTFSSSAKFDYLAINSNGAKSCQVSGTVYSAASGANPSGEKICWP
jgi:type IV pilus assembly protein PilE